MSVREITAAAQRLTRKMFGTGKDRYPKLGIARQRTAYTYWDDTPEVRFSGIWVGRAMSRARLYGGLVQPDGEIIEAPKDHPVHELVNAIGGGPTGQSQMLEAIGPHLVVAGEAWVVVNPAKQKNPFLEQSSYDWGVVAVTEMEDKAVGNRAGRLFKVNGEEVWVPPDDDDHDDPLDEQPVAIRIWNPHPASFVDADSPVMAAFGILDELRLLNAAVAAIAKSRLGGRGLVGIPAGTRLPDGDDLLERIMEVAATAYSDPDSAAAVVPILLELPKDTTLQRITFESDFDRLAIDLREEAIRRYATGSDTPAEVLLGRVDMNHWGVWALQDEAIRVGVEPRLATVCDALNRGWIWPNLDGDQTAVVWFDTSNLRVRTNRSQTAIELGRDGTITAKAVRREAGFEDDDAPPSAHAKLSTLLKVANAIPNDDPNRAVVSARIVALLDELEIEADIGAPSSSDITEPTDLPEVDLPVDETNAPPEEMPDTTEAPPDQTDADVLAAAVDQLVSRALERAGSRILGSSPRAQRPQTKDVRASEIHTKMPPGPEDVERLLAGAWERVPEIAERYAVDPDCLTDVLHQYTQDLLLSGSSHQFDRVPILIRQASCLNTAGV